MTTMTNHRISRRLLALLLAALAGAVLPACGDNEGDREDLEAALDRTRELSYRFSYSDSRPDETVTVRGFTEDDFRVKARVDYDGEPGFEQVISDDQLAVRFFVPERVDDFVDPAFDGEKGAETELEGISSVDALKSRRWVVDATGAPLLGGGAPKPSDIGVDPVRDALSALDYVERSLQQAVAVEKFNPDDLSPVYAASEDNFPEPQDGSGVDRYDLRRPDLPSFSAGGSGGDSEQIGTQHFRKMAVYVKDGVIIRVIERVEAIGSFFDEVVGFMLRLLDEIDAPQEAVDGMKEFAKSDLPEEERSETLLEIINAGLRQFGFDPILNREMVFDIADHGSFNAVALPDAAAGDEIINGSLTALVVSGSVLDEVEGEGGEVSGGGDPTLDEGGADGESSEGEGSEGEGSESGGEEVPGGGGGIGGT